MTFPNRPAPLDSEAARGQARILKHVLRDDAVRGPVKVGQLIAELGGGDDVEGQLVDLCEIGLMEVVPDEMVQPTEPAIRYRELSRYMR